MSENHGGKYDEVIELFLNFRKIEDDTQALVFLQTEIKTKVREYTRGAIKFGDLEKGEKFIRLPMNGFDCCRYSGMSLKENGYILFKKCNGKKNKPMATRVGSLEKISFNNEDLVLRIIPRYKKET